MASPAELMQRISDITGTPLPTVVDIDRRLVKAGLRTKGGRGFSAAQMKPVDAARLLTGILGSRQSNEAAETVSRYMQTHVDKARSSEHLFAKTGVIDLEAMPARHGFVDALTALIASAANGAIAEMNSEIGAPNIEVYAFTRTTRGRIRLSGPPNQIVASVEYAPGGPRRAAWQAGDLEQSRRITEHTIVSVAELLAGSNAS